MNRANAIVGYGLGGTPLDRADDRRCDACFSATASRPSTSARFALGAADPLGKIGLLLALVGILFAVGGASIDTVFAGAYNLAQFCGWEWGRYRHPSGRPTLHAHLVRPARPRDGDRHDRRRPGRC